MRMHQPGYCSVVFRVLGDFGDARQAVGWRKMKISTDCNIHGRTRDTGKKKCGSCDTERKKIMLNNNTLCVAGHPSKICTSRFSYCADTSNPSQNSLLAHPRHLSVLLLGQFRAIPAHYAKYQAPIPSVPLAVPSIQPAPSRRSYTTPATSRRSVTDRPGKWCRTPGLPSKAPTPRTRRSQLSQLCQ